MRNKDEYYIKIYKIIQNEVLTTEKRLNKKFTKLEYYLEFKKHLEHHREVSNKMLKIELYEKRYVDDCNVLFFRGILNFVNRYIKVIDSEIECIKEYDFKIVKVNTQTYTDALKKYKSHSKISRIMIDGYKSIEELKYDFDNPNEFEIRFKNTTEFVKFALKPVLKDYFRKRLICSKNKHIKRK